MMAASGLVRSRIATASSSLPARSLAMYAGMSLWMGQPATHGAALTHMPPKIEW